MRYERITSGFVQQKRSTSIPYILICSLEIGCHQVLREAEEKASNIDEIVLVGGSTRIPKVRPGQTDYSAI